MGNDPKHELSAIHLVNGKTDSINRNAAFMSNIFGNRFGRFNPEFYIVWMFNDLRNFCLLYTSDAADE